MQLTELQAKMVAAGTPIPEDHRFFTSISEFNLEATGIERVSIQEFLTSDDASVLLPRIIQGTLREAAEPILIFKQFFDIIRLTGGTSIEFPSVSAMTAGDIGEGQDYPKAIIDFALHKSLTIRVGKYGLMFGATDECVQDSLWDVIGMLTRGAGRAMARWEEQKRSNAFYDAGHIRFDGDLATTNPASPAAPTGYGYDSTAAPGTGFGSLGKNGTLSTLDWIEIIATLMANEMTPTDVLMHPLYWPAYARTLFVGGNGNVSKRWDPRSIPLGTAAIGAAMPFAMNTILSPRVFFNRMTKKGDIYVVDRSEVGVELVKEDLTTEEWREPNADIRNIKVKARKGWGILNHGRAIAVARNIRAAESYDPTVSFVHNV